MTELLEQGSEDWLQARCGKVTASKVGDVMARTKSGYSASRSTYMGQLIAERLTGKPTEGFTSAAMQWGTDTEPQARAWYEFENDVTVEQVGLILHPDMDMAAASPDGLVDSDGLFEAKCPNTATHIGYLLNAKVPKKYLLQMQWQMACTGRQWCDFLSFDPRMPEDLNSFQVRVSRDEEMINELESEVRKFLSEIDDKIKALKTI